MEIDIVIGNRRLELRISSIFCWLSTISHVIKVTVLYSIRIRVKHPSIHESDPKMVGMRVRMIKRNPILTRHSLIDEYRSCEDSSIYTCCIDAISWFLILKELASHTNSGSLVTVRYRSIAVQLEKIIERAVRMDPYYPIFYTRECLASVCSCWRHPLVPIISSIKNRKCGAGWMNIFTSKPSRESQPSCRFVDSEQRRPPDDPMRYSGFLEFFFREFSIMFLYADGPKSWEYLECCPEFVSLPYPLHDIICILCVVVKKNSRSGTVVGKIGGDERARDSFHKIINYIIPSNSSTIFSTSLSPAL